MMKGGGPHFSNKHTLHSNSLYNYNVCWCAKNALLRKCTLKCEIMGWERSTSVN